VTDWDINFRLSSNAQTRETKIDARPISEAFARILVNDVAVAAQDETYNRLRKTLIKDVRNSVRTEINNMAMKIGGGILLRDAYKGPYGDLSFSDNNTNGMSETFKKFFGRERDFQRQNAGIRWKARSPHYLKRKKKDPAARIKGQWWGYTGELKRYLSNMSFRHYEESFGPLAVLFTRVSHKDPTGQRTLRWSSKTAPKVTRTGASGLVSSSIQVGRLEVLVFNKITPQMMSGLRNFNPRNSRPAPDDPGVAQLFPDGRNRDKLLRKSASRRVFSYYTRADGSKRRRRGVPPDIITPSFRPAIDPFVSFYLTRAIPNAVWRRSESLVGGVTANNIGAQYEGF
jgi:hypothetical protein